MATPGRTAADYMAETQAKIQGNLQKEQMDSLGNALGRILTGQYALRGKRADRGNKISEAIANYERALNSGVPAAQIKAIADLRKMERELPVKFASAAYAPNDALLNAVSTSIPVGLKDKDPRDPQVAQVAWQTFFMDARATDGNLLGSWRKMIEMYGEPTEAYYGASNPAVANAAKNFFNKKKVAEQNAKLFEENMNSLSAVGEPYEAFVERTGMPAESDDTVRAFLKSYPDLEARLPGPNAPFIDQLRGMVQDPEKNKAFFSDIDASLAAAGEQEEKYLGLMGIGEEGAATRAQTDREKLAGWIQRPDVQEWAKKWGLNLGTVREVTPEIQKLIDAGQISKDDLVNGRLYTSSPDDVRAVNLAFRQMERNPQKNIFYQMGLTRQAGPRTVMEIEEIVRPEGLKAVRGGLIVGENGKTARIVQLEDNSYAIGDAEGKKFTRLSVESGDQMVKNVQMVDFPEGASVPGLGPYTRTRRIQSLGPEYGRDMPGSERGIDLDTGKLVVIPLEKIASKEVTHGGVAKKSLGEMLLEGRAAATRRKEGIGLTEEDINAMDIGKEATKGQIRESAQTTAEIAKGLPPVPASYVGEGLVGRMRGPLTEAEIARQDARTAAGAAGVSPFEQVKPGDYKEQKISSSPVDTATEQAAEGVSEAAAPKPRLPLVSPAPGVVTAGMPASAPKQGPKGGVLSADVRDTYLNKAVREELAKRPGGNVSPASAEQYAAARAAALKKGATTEPIAEPEETTQAERSTPAGDAAARKAFEAARAARRTYPTPAGPPPVSPLP